MLADVTTPDLLKWAATALTLTGAGTSAADLGRRATGWGFAALAAGSTCWLGAAQPRAGDAARPD